MNHNIRLGNLHHKWQLWFLSTHLLQNHSMCSNEVNCMNFDLLSSIVAVVFVHCCKVCFSSVRLYGSGGYKSIIFVKSAFLQCSCLLTCSFEQAIIFVFNKSRTTTFTTDEFQLDSDKFVSAIFYF